MNLANKLTIFRIILVPIFVIIAYLGQLGLINGEFLGISITLQPCVWNCYSNDNNGCNFYNCIHYR